MFVCMLDLLKQLNGFLIRRSGGIYWQMGVI